jgi:hypothetical protein
VCFVGRVPGMGTDALVGIAQMCNAKLCISNKRSVGLWATETVGMMIEVWGMRGLRFWVLLS